MDSSVSSTRERVVRLIEREAGSAIDVGGWERLSGGAIQENIACDAHVHEGALAGDHRWVVRTDAASSVDVSHTRDEEFALLVIAHEAGMRVPRPLWLGDDG